MNMEIVIGKDTKILREPAQPVKEVTPEIRQLVRKMKTKMRQADGIGLAANQIGQNLKIFVIDRAHLGYGDEVPEAYINPKFVSVSGKNIGIEEGCLSLPRLYGKVQRKEKVVIAALNEMGRKVKVKAEGLLAIVLQHEMDHLAGILFIDKAQEVQELTDEEVGKSKI